ncbi:MAG: hypothetical protein QMD36_05350 [Candidatus Aenigmarchaeota archaeon]|nr:hypothetical protein [Candidatus Aenigmarchaeota archaeon]
MKTWFRVAVSLCVIFGALGLLFLFKTLQIPTDATGEFILITGAGTLIIGGILLLILTSLSVMSARIAVEKEKPIEGMIKSIESKLLHDIYNMEPENIEGKFAWNIGAYAVYLRSQKVKNLSVYKAFVSAIKNVAQRLKDYLMKNTPKLEIYTLDDLSSSEPKTISLIDRFYKLYLAIQQAGKYRRGYKPEFIPRRYLKSVL